MSVVNLSNTNQYNNLVSNNPNNLIVIDFSAKWCGPCKRIAPLYNQISQNMKNVVFCKVDVNDSPDLATKFGIRSMPTFVFIKGGKVITSFAGADVNKLQSTCQRLQ